MIQILTILTVSLAISLAGAVIAVVVREDWRHHPQRRPVLVVFSVLYYGLFAWGLWELLQLLLERTRP